MSLIIFRKKIDIFTVKYVLRTPFWFHYTIRFLCQWWSYYLALSLGCSLSKHIILIFVRILSKLGQLGQSMKSLSKVEMLYINSDSQIYIESWQRHKWSGFCEEKINPIVLFFLHLRLTPSSWATSYLSFPRCSDTEQRQNNLSHMPTSSASKVSLSLGDMFY